MGRLRPEGLESGHAREPLVEVMEPGCPRNALPPA